MGQFGEMHDKASSHLLIGVGSGIEKSGYNILKPTVTGSMQSSFTVLVLVRK